MRASLGTTIETIRIGSNTAPVTTRARAGGRFPRNACDFGFGGFVFKVSEPPGGWSCYRQEVNVRYSQAVLTSLRVSDQF